MNQELEEFRERIEKRSDDKNLATHKLTFMVKGIFSSLAYPFAYYAGQGFSSDQLFPCVWECVRNMEAIGLSVLFLTSDGASPNRRFYRLHLLDDFENTSAKGVVYWCWNRYAPSREKRKIFFICDVPHLIKTIRNNFENSHAHKKTRNLMVGIYIFDPIKTKILQ